MVGEPFHYEGQNYYYNQGQPMGAYSSFPMFALCHHVVVKVAANRVFGNTKYSRYALLGDDIVLTHNPVKEKYIEIIRDNFKVEISEKKSYSGNLYEFAKRIFMETQEVTGFQISGIIDG